MKAPHHIHYLRRQELDPVKWDACIEADPNGLIYARMFFLDRMTMGQWDALVMEDYKAVMPLTWNRKYGFRYLFQPFCTPSLGLFADGGSLGQAGLLSSFLRAIPKKFKYWDIDLNEANDMYPGISDPAAAVSDPVTALFSPPISRLRVTARTNYLLHLNKEKEELDQGYHRLARRMCNKAMSERLQIVRNASPGEIIQQYRAGYGRKHPRIRQVLYERLGSCAGMALAAGNATTYLANWPTGEIAAFYLVLSDRRFVYSLLGGSTQKGREVSAFYLLTDAAIKDHAPTDRIFRFEGSDMPGIASFNASFGSTPKQYHHLLRNDLPFPLNYLK
jgi:hypothetical protein